MSIEQIKSKVISIPDFPRQGVLFRDLGPVLACTETRKMALELMTAPWRAYKEGGGLTKVGGFEARGLSLGMALALALDVPFFMLRKKGKLPGRVHAQAYGLEYGQDIIEMSDYAVEPGDHVLLVDDVLATGGTAAAGMKMIEEAAGATCIGLSVLVELTALEGRAAINRPVSTAIAY